MTPPRILDYWPDSEPPQWQSWLPQRPLSFPTNPGDKEIPLRRNDVPEGWTQVLAHAHLSLAVLRTPT